jgi:hypothetical protein
MQAVPFTRLFSRNNTNLPENQQTHPPEFFHEIHQILPTPEVLFPSAHWFKYLEQINDKIPSDRYQWVSTMLKQLTRAVKAHELGPYALAFESINEPGNEKKSAKSLLRQDPFNVDLYLGYSILERKQGNKASARTVLSAALSLPSITSHDRVCLGIEAARAELEDGELAKVASHLCRLVKDASKSDNAPVLESAEASPSQILKARQFLLTNRDYKISSGEVAHAVIYAEGLVLLEYLTQRSEKEPSSQKQGDIWSAIISIKQCSKDLVSHGQQHCPSHEKFLQFAARLLYYHASHGFVSFSPLPYRYIFIFSSSSPSPRQT